MRYDKKIEIISQIAELNDFLPDTEQNEDTLLVMDMDDMLVRGDGTLGSDTWFSTSIKKGRDVLDILRDMGCAYSLMQYRTVEPDTCEVLKDILNRPNIDYIIMTSRGMMHYSQTVKHLRDAGLGDLMIRPNMVNIRNADDILPKSDEEGDPVMYPRLSQVRYIDNICMCAGNDKGEIMEEIMYRSKKRYQRIIFVDDSISNVNKVHNRFMSPQKTKVFDNIKTYSIHYSFMEVEKRHYDDDALKRDDQKLHYLKNTIAYLNGKATIDYILSLNVLLVISMMWWFVFKFLGIISC